MHWVSGTWLWAKHRARSTSSGTPIYLERTPSTDDRRNRRRTWSLPTNPPDDSSNSSASTGSRSRGSSTSHGSTHAHSQHYSSRRHSHAHAHTHTHTYNYDANPNHNPNLLAVAQLRCIRCGGLRSREYHYLHFDDPIAYPSIGICSRRKTRCARAKSDPVPLGQPPATAVAPCFDIPELADTSPAMARPVTAGADPEKERYYGLSMNLMRMKSLG
ncbi:uncharacterized protein DSM5745_08507 [Aspergillus mulundensis]|uniref:Uncharacterized protein n=1 Tax=Aspergillus mulundensis TaxID=1810919 RepID=A0A3D8R430_9EURO|nr:Uncharacterized protein DSM5745_08507 [Aspergillus mulundensis]RDW68747.1 Uncharacterized protein DSM5745_08507 [Aspergillus mulundensis]